jgi:hypothetical protein
MESGFLANPGDGSGEGISPIPFPLMGKEPDKYKKIPVSGKTPEAYFLSLSR